MDMLAQALIQGFLIGGTYGLVALGLGLIYSVSNIVSFAHGDFMSLAMYLSVSLFAAFAMDPYVSVFITFPVLALVGWGLYYFILRPVIGSNSLMIIQLTLGLTFLLQNGLLMVYGGQMLRVPSMVESKLFLMGDTVMRWPLLIAFIASLALSALLYLMLTRTDFGRQIRAVNQNPKAAALMGVNVTQVRTLVFALGIALLAVAGSLLLPGATLQPGMGLRYTVITLLILVLGGMSNFIGILLGGYIIGLSEAVGTTFLSGVSGMILPYALFIVIMLFRPAGLLGSR
ncbi:MAG: branched-chain amino acid ABC transporter permease [Magnetospirillum sp.]